MGEMQKRDIIYFQEGCTAFLNENFPIPDDVTKLQFDAVAVVDQSIIKQENLKGEDCGKRGCGRSLKATSTNLQVTFRVFVTIYPGDLDGFDLHSSINSYFANPRVVEDLQIALNQLSNFFMANAVDGSLRSSRRNNGSGSFPSAAYGAISGVIMSLTGAVLFTMWYRKRRIFSRTGRSASNWGFKRNGSHMVSKSMSSTEANLTVQSRGMGAFLQSYTSGSSANSQMYQTSQGSIYPVEPIEASLVIEPGVRAYNHNGNKPSLIQFETNIEVPPTPAPETATPAHYDLSQFDPEDPALGAVSLLKRILFVDWACYDC